MLPRALHRRSPHRLHLRRAPRRGVPARVSGSPCRERRRAGSIRRGCSTSASTSSSARSSGAKALLVVVEWDHFTSSPREFLSLARSGGVFYGGLILAVSVAFWYIRRHRLPFWQTCDVFAPGIALGPRDRAARVPGRGLLLRAPDERAVGGDVHESGRGGQCGDAAWRATPPYAALRESSRSCSSSGCSSRTERRGRAVCGAHVLAVHAAVRDLAVRDRVLPRRPARPRLRRPLDLAVHLRRARADEPRHARRGWRVVPRRRPGAGQRASQKAS